MSYLQGAFTISQDVLLTGGNLLDYAGVAGTTRTAGAMTILRLDTKQGLTRPWQVTAWTIQGRGALNKGTGKVGGQLGRVYASLLFGSFTPVGPSAPLNPDAPFTAPIPEAMPNLITLYDGATAAPFPLTPSTNQASQSGFFASSQQLPEPQIVGPSDQIGIGIWLTPSILYDGTTAILLANLHYSVTYSEVR